MKSSVLLREFMSFCKIIGFTKRIYEYKSLSPNHVFTFKISRFTIFIFLLMILWFFIKIINFLNKIGPLWAHKGPYGPIRALWAHMGLKKFLTQAQLCNFLISAMGCISEEKHRPLLPVMLNELHCIPTLPVQSHLSWNSYGPIRARFWLNN